MRIIQPPFLLIGSGEPILYAASAPFTVTAADVELNQYSLPAETAAFTVSGADVTLSTPRGWWTPTWWSSEWWQEPWWGPIEASRTLPVDSATYTVSGTDVDLNKGHTIPAATASFVVTGTAVTVAKGSKVNVDPAAFTVTGSDVTFNYRSLPAETTLFTVTPSADIELTYTPHITRQIDIDAATFDVTASDAGLEKGFVVPAATTAYAVTAKDISLDVDTELYALGATFSVSASDVALVGAGYTFSVDSASFSVSASDITLSKAAVEVTFGQYDKTNIIKPETHGFRVSPEGQGFFL